MGNTVALACGVNLSGLVCGRCRMEHVKEALMPCLDERFHFLVLFFRGGGDYIVFLFLTIIFINF